MSLALVSSLLLALGGSQTSATTPTTESPNLETAHLILVASSKTGGEAAAVLAKIPRVDFVSMAGGYPKVVDSGTIKGLRPGFQVVVAGMCPAKKEARLIAEVLGLAGGLAAVVREVQVPAADLACPSLTSADASSLPVVARAPLDNRFPDIRWVLRQKKLNSECSAYALGVEVGKTLVFQKSHRDEGCRASSSFIRRFKAGIVKVGEVSYARVSERADWHDNGTFNEFLMGLSCTGVHELLDVGDQYKVATNIAAAGDGSGRTRLRLRWNGMLLDGRADGAEIEYIRSADGCSFEEAKAGP